MGNSEHYETSFSSTTNLTEIIHTLLALLLLYGCESWTVKQKDIRIPNIVNMQFVRHKAGYSLEDHRRKEDTSKKHDMDQTKIKIRTV